jgi:hypothetical protein
MFVTLSNISNDLVFCRSLWNREGDVGICGGDGGLYCGREDEEDPEDLIGVLSPLQVEDSGGIWEGAEISTVGWRGGLHLALLRCRDGFLKLSMSHPPNAMQWRSRK